MNLHTLKQEFFDYVHELYESSMRNRYIKYITLIIGISAVCLLVFAGYSFFEKRKSHHAYASLMECLIKFNEISESEPHNWEEIIALCTQKKAAHSSSALAPYFDLIHTDALLKKGAHAEALESIQKAANATKSNDIAPLIKLKYALMLLESNDQIARKQGLEKLISLTKNNQNRTRDMALYQLGRYFFAINENEKAKEAWNTLISQTEMNTVSPSPWATLAQQKLNQLL